MSNSLHPQEPVGRDSLDGLLDTLAPPAASGALRAAVYRAGQAAAPPAAFTRVPSRPAPSQSWLGRLARAASGLTMRPVPAMAAIMLAVAIGWALPDPFNPAGPGSHAGGGTTVASAGQGGETGIQAYYAGLETAEQEAESLLLGSYDDDYLPVEGDDGTEAGIWMSAYSSEGLDLE